MSTLADQEEGRLREELRREQASNRHYARRCPGMAETGCYRAPPKPPAEFFTVQDCLKYRIDREQARFNPARCSKRGQR